MRLYIYLLYYYKSELELGLESKLEFELPYRVANAELLVGVVVGAAYYIR
jgi:hypothetical protein